MNQALEFAPNNNWLEGFAKAAEEAGLCGEQAVAELLKTASRVKLMREDSNFSDGYNEELEKLAQPVVIPPPPGNPNRWLSVLGKAKNLGRYGAGAAITAGLGLAGYGAYDALRHKWGRNTDDAAMMRQLESLESLNLPTWQKNILMRDMMGQEHLKYQQAGAAYRPFGNEGGGGYGGPRPYDRQEYYTPWWQRRR